MVIAEKLLPGDRRALVYPLTYGRARLCAGDVSDRYGFDQAY